MFHIICHQGVTNENSTEILVYPSEWPKSESLITASVGEDVEQEELSFIPGGNAKWYINSRR